MGKGRFSGRRAWITGASGGIGEALALEFAAEGAELILSARRREELERVRESCVAPERVSVVPLDLAVGDNTLSDFAARVWEENGAIDVMVHNGGISQRSLMRETTLDVDRRIMEVNYFGAVALTKGLLPLMLERNGGHFLVVSSVAGKVGIPLRSAYCASKHALHGFFGSLRAEYFAEGLRVTMACPGFIKTDVSVNALTGDGSPQGTMDEAQAAGMPAGEAARRMVAAVAAEKNEVYLGGKEILGIYLNRLSPSLAARVMRGVKVT